MKSQIEYQIESYNLLKDLPCDFGGHFRREIPYDGKSYLYRCFNANNAKKLVNLIKSKKEPKEIIAFKPSCLLACSECGEELLMGCDGHQVICLNPCKYPDGHPPYEFELNVPSGKMVFGNDFRDQFRVLGTYNINTTSGCAKTSLKYAEVGMAHAFVGNTCPGIYRINKQLFAVGCDNKGRNPVKNSRIIGGICTDLWWYSIVDYDEYVKRYGVPNKSCVFSCKPGVYKFTHQYHLTRDTENELFTKINWIRKPDPIRDFQAEFLSKNITAGQSVMSHLNGYPDLYNYSGKGKPNMQSIIKAAQQILFTSEAFHEYHPNGWICGGVDITEKSPTIKIPYFNEPFYCLDFNEYGFLPNLAGVGKELFPERERNGGLNKEFLELAFNLLHCGLTFGITNDERRKKSYLSLMKKTFNGLKKKYPESVPNYCK